MKDNFSNHAADYAKYRPVYPEALYEHLLSLVAHKNAAWDVATGNAQVATVLSKTFNRVLATDLSEQQLKQASQIPNIEYRVQTAEEDFNQTEQFDLITVAQAIHWFDFDTFYKQVYQHLNPEGILAVIGYSVLKTRGKLNEVIQHFYTEITNDYWDPERKYLDDHYQSIPFPFEELEMPKMHIQVNWTQDQLLNYLNTWSAVKHFEKKQGSNPVELIRDAVKENWGSDEYRIFEFPLLLRVGKPLKSKIPTK
ncbi:MULTISPECIES: class I SAM-dependent methyltransferase [unclassified Leeuwenhoekiella]|uniref:class I SAM-dependent methyltransferase n=1 Tax=unclassified Leeuwenhoekiella TaxID=2615029 RepID=UPI000C6B1735|nr:MULTISPECIES: class I SAM-dependent methyltransferase [unclassified Leeuwenhoekiella]MAW93695.1 SAM-dependent methyltransferase [Leeuwenhoekiella sp.]MBA83081.1 SAM-dependent methyltransferase [Leeuwenhoekiella sp.]|tara:strand:+ start:51344 stop:52102 length:759 start_codon:yes stop_codon:yes gene_type:complete